MAARAEVCMATSKFNSARGFCGRSLKLTKFMRVTQSRMLLRMNIL